MLPLQAFVNNSQANGMSHTKKYRDYPILPAPNDIDYKPHAR